MGCSRATIILNPLLVLLEFNTHLDPFTGRSETFCDQWSRLTVSELIVQSPRRDNLEHAMDLGPSDRPGILYNCEDSSSLGLSALSETFCSQ